MKDKIRTFIAIDLSRSIKKMLSKYIRDISGATYEYKWVARDNLHITLAFLGDITYDDIPLIAAAMERAAASHKPFKAQIGSVGTFASVIWVGLARGEEKCREVYDSLKGELMMANLHLDDRRYHPHITIARSRRRMTPEEKRKFETNEPPDQREIEVSDIILFESKLQPRGPEYIPLKRLRFGQKITE
jgi:2'-5' RNA ligase